MIKFIIIFSICSFLNVILNTFKTIIMHKEEVHSSALINMITFGFYTVVVVLMAGEMPLWIKVVITAVTNFVGVEVSMKILKLFQKDKLWKVETTINVVDKDAVAEMLRNAGLPFNYINGIGKYVIFNIFCETQKESLAVKEILKKFNAKYFAMESKIL